TNVTFAKNQGIGTIIDDDGPPQFTVNDVTANENAGTAIFTVTLAPVSASSVTVNFSTANGTAIAGLDYIATSGTLTFNAGVMTQTFSVPIINDNVSEPTETFTVNLTAAVGAGIADAQGIGTIVDDEGAPLI